MENLIFYALLGIATIGNLAFFLIKKSIEVKRLKAEIDIFQIERMFWEKKSFDSIYEVYSKISSDEKVDLIANEAIIEYLTTKTKSAFELEKIIHHLNLGPRWCWYKIIKNIKKAISPEKAAQFYSAYLFDEIVYGANNREAKKFLLETYHGEELFTDTAIQSLRKIVDSPIGEDLKIKDTFCSEIDKLSQKI